jgi:hypothetical protein
LQQTGAVLPERVQADATGWHANRSGYGKSAACSTAYRLWIRHDGMKHSVARHLDLVGGARQTKSRDCGQVPVPLQTCD